MNWMRVTTQLLCRLFVAGSAGTDVVKRTTRELDVHGAAVDDGQRGASRPSATTSSFIIDRCSSQVPPALVASPSTLLRRPNVSLLSGDVKLNQKSTASRLMPPPQSCPWVGLTHGLGRNFLVFGGLGWVHYSKSTKALKGLCYRILSTIR